MNWEWIIYGGLIWMGLAILIGMITGALIKGAEIRARSQENNFIQLLERSINDK